METILKIGISGVQGEECLMMTDDTGNDNLTFLDDDHEDYNDDETLNVHSSGDLHPLSMVDIFEMGK